MTVLLDPNTGDCLCIREVESWEIEQHDGNGIDSLNFKLVKKSGEKVTYTLYGEFNSKSYLTETFGAYKEALYENLASVYDPKKDLLNLIKAQQKAMKVALKAKKR